MKHGETTSRLARVVPVVWIASSLAWMATIIVSDPPAWVLAIWIAATLGPITMLDETGSS